MNTTPKLSTDQIEKGWRETFSVDNPFCPCDLRSFTKAVNWTLRALAPPSGEGVVIATTCAQGPLGEVEFSPEDWAKLEALPEGTKLYTTPQSAPVDGDAVQQALLVINDAGNDARHRGDYARANALVRARVTLYRASATPPPASQERGGDSLRELLIDCQLAIESIPRDSSAKDDLVNRLTTAITRKFQSDNVRFVETLPRKLSEKPPSSTAEASINPPEIDSKLIPDAAEQAKPDEGPRCYQCMQKVSVLFSDGRCVKCTREVPT